MALSTAGMLVSSGFEHGSPDDCIDTYEEYNEDGKIVRKTPPGYILTNEMA